MASEVAELVLRALPQVTRKQVRCWSDSAITLWWHGTDPGKLVPFCANRVQKLRETGFPFLYVNTKENPADLASRGCRVEDLKGTLWREGPGFLREPEAKWPETRFKREDFKNEERLGVRKAHAVNLHTRVQAVLPPLSQTRNNETRPLYEVYSSFDKMLNVTAFVQRAIKKFKEKKSKKSNAKPVDISLAREQFITIAERAAAMTYWVRKVQQEVFPDELEALNAQSDVPRRSRVKREAPYLDARGVLRVGGRTQRANLKYETRHQILLARHAFTTLLVTSEHKKAGHPSRDNLQGHLRQQFWIVSGRRIIRQVQSRCPKCSRYSARAAQQQMSQLPWERLKTEGCFSQTGIDYAGPVFVRTTPRTTQIRPAWIAVFTCMATRAVHLELVTSNSTRDFLMALKRFSSIRGYPQVIWTDNASQFQAAQKELTDVIPNSPNLQAEVAKLGVEWKFTPPYSSHQGGIWESIVKAVKMPFRKVLRRRAVTIEEAQTLLAEIMARLNDRPLLPLGEDSWEVLTPSMLLHGRRINPYFPVDYYAEHPGSQG